MDLGLDQYLKSEVLHFYVFDSKEEQMDEYVGKASVPLLSLTDDKAVAGEAFLSVRPPVPQLEVFSHVCCLNNKNCVNKK